MLTTLGLSAPAIEPEKKVPAFKIPADTPLLYQRRPYDRADAISIRAEMTSIQNALAALSEPEVLQTLFTLRVDAIEHWEELRLELGRFGQNQVVAETSRPQGNVFRKRGHGHDASALLAEYQSIANAIVAFESHDVLRTLAYLRINANLFREGLVGELAAINARLPLHLKDGRVNNEPPAPVDFGPPIDRRCAESRGFRQAVTPARAVLGSSRVVA